MSMQLLNDEGDQPNGKLQLHCTFFIPLNDNDGNRQPVDRFAWLEKKLLAQAGGLTRYYPGYGLWLPPEASIPCPDVIIPFHVVTTNGPETEVWLADLATEIRQVFEQTRVFVLAQPLWLLETKPLAGKDTELEFLPLPN